MKLGFWHRLYLVAFFIALFAPIAFTVYDDSGAQDRAIRYYSDCSLRVLTSPDAGSEYIKTSMGQCAKNTDSLRNVGPFWPRATSDMPATALIFAALYLACWTIVVVARWVWAGRKYRTGIKSA